MRLDATTSLPDGRRVRLRFPQVSDHARIVHLHDRLGISVDEIELARALRFDPRTRTVLCATVWDGERETIVGWAAAERGATDLDLVLADEAVTPGIGDLLRGALTAHVRTAA